MQWRRWHGDTATYTGTLLDLGWGIPRKRGAWGLRAALFDLAFGYVSGFPLRDILPFATRSLLPRRAAVISDTGMEANK